MPLYEYRCEPCAIEVDRLCSMDARDVQFCTCGVKLIRTEIACVAEPRQDTLFRTAAILSDGRRMSGNFGPKIRDGTPLAHGRRPTRADRMRAPWKTWK